MRDLPRLTAYGRTTGLVRAGRIDRVHVDADNDNEEWPVIVWIGQDHFPLHEEVVEFRDPEVGDWLVIPQRGAAWHFDEAVIFSDRQFNVLYDNAGRGREAASAKPRFSVGTEQ